MSGRVAAASDKGIACSKVCWHLVSGSIAPFLLRPQPRWLSERVDSPSSAAADQMIPIAFGPALAFALGIARHCALANLHRQPRLRVVSVAEVVESQPTRAAAVAAKSGANHAFIALASLVPGFAQALGFTALATLASLR